MGTHCSPVVSQFKFFQFFLYYFPGFPVLEMGERQQIAVVLLSSYLALILLSCLQTIKSEESKQISSFGSSDVKENPISHRRKRQEDSEDSDNQQSGPGPVELSALSSLARGVRCRGMRIMDEKTLEIDELDYDGEGPAAWFMVGNHPNWDDEFVDLGGTIIPDETGSCDLLKEYVTKDVKLVLPGDMKWSDMNYLSVFCLRFNHNFGSVGIPSNMNLPNGTGKGKNLEECPQDPEEAIDPDAGRPRPRPQRPTGGRPSSGTGGSSGGGSGGGILGGLINILG